MTQLQTKKQAKVGGKSPANFAIYLLHSSHVKFVPFLKRKPAKPCERKAIKWAQNWLQKEMQMAKEESDKKDRNRFAKKINK